MIIKYDIPDGPFRESHDYQEACYQDTIKDVKNYVIEEMDIFSSIISRADRTSEDLYSARCRALRIMERVMGLVALANTVSPLAEDTEDTRKY